MIGLFPAGVIRRPARALEEDHIAVPSAKSALPCLALLTLAACASDMQFDETGGIRITRSACPAVAVPVHTGDVTLFDPPASRDARAIDVTASITNVRATCTEVGDRLENSVTFEVRASRMSAQGPREVVLPYFVTVMRGGTQITAKRVGRVALLFEAGQTRASEQVAASGSIVRAEAMIPEEVQRQINRKRKPGDDDAAIDPLSDPAIRAAVSRASFELVVGFQLDEAQLAYNATR